MSDLTIRRYRPADADALWDLHERALRHAGVYDEEYAHLDADLRNVTGEYLEAGGEFIIGEHEGELVAMGALQPASAVDHHEGDEATGVVRRMRVEPDLHRRGYATAILERLEARADELGWDRLVLDTTEHQEAARAFYEAHGYEVVRSRETPVGEMFFYEKSLE